MGKLRYFSNQGDLRDFIRNNSTTLKDLYFIKNLTARKVAENQNIFFDSRFARLLTEELGKKGMGLGGKRQGSGNKKGIKFCGTCRRKLEKDENCNCSDRPRNAP